MQPLRRDDEVDAAVVGGDGEARLGTHERLVLHPDLVGALDDDGTACVGIAAADDQLAEDVAVGVQRRRVRGGVGIGERLEHVVVHDDRRARSARGLGMVGRDRGDRLARVADDVVGEHRSKTELNQARRLAVVDDVDDGLGDRHVDAVAARQIGHRLAGLDALGGLPGDRDGLLRGVIPRPRLVPKVWLRESGEEQVATRSPRPARPEKVSGSAPMRQAEPGGLGEAAGDQRAPWRCRRGPCRRRCRRRGR